mmetsp:Transcript_16746/g.25814  ORF Transcript_16746/g.25814 Transcript_16746/m.25814 type:complete len:117 (+) Transcript_16746:182-532(+)|eukprot:CAMPEP_0170511034 /NCGR_PEP_ID=MMETSP0208-20121228/66086_1 /TAXON_ID=197538 /ORGANISM="Strombidium inclinatum, Strain S3" /LENGTH=116 /DNA_ID=CAMNT_0010794537 /DNA_START=105 /DNA_END=455 /DNA_ORIENTATION=+
MTVIKGIQKRVLDQRMAAPYIGMAIKLISRVVTAFLMMSRYQDFMTRIPFEAHLFWYDTIAWLNRLMPLEIFFNHRRDNRVRGVFTLKDYITTNFTDQDQYAYAILEIKKDLEERT